MGLTFIRGEPGSAAPTGWKDISGVIRRGAAEDRFPADSRTMLAFRGEEVVARLAMGTRDDFAGAQGRTGYVGWYEASDREAGVALLRRALEELFAEGAKRVVGPLNGTTWHRYRLVIPDSEGRKLPGDVPFLSEPGNPIEYPLHFESAGFEPHLEYESRIIREPQRDPEVFQAAVRLDSLGVTIRGIDMDRFEEELVALHQLSVIAFAENPYFSPIGLDEFTAMNRAVRPLVDPALVRLAWGLDGELLGFVFAFMDPLATGPRVILKTLVSHPDARAMGLGGLLTDAINRAAAERGASVIHALMQASNFSTRISSRRDSELFRRYRLYVAEPG
ncbi:MAG: GNAT family N-acetyltransferase [Gemmatimonadetes bacterium]|nr:GNAT family N-acetyltransferase [Gemmatimonadota bacterium]